MGPSADASDTTFPDLITSEKLQNVKFRLCKGTMHETLVGILIGFPVISLSRKGTFVCVWKNLSSFDLIPMRNVSIQASSNVMNMSWWNVVIQQSCHGFETIAWPIAKPHITRECWWLSSCGETRCKSASLFAFLRKILRAWSSRVWRCDGARWPGLVCDVRPGRCLWE